MLFAECLTSMHKTKEEKDKNGIKKGRGGESKESRNRSTTLFPGCVAVRGQLRSQAFPSTEGCGYGTQVSSGLQELSDPSLHPDTI